MPIKTEATGGINKYPHKIVTNKLKKAAKELIEELDYAGIWSGQGTIVKGKDLRLDMQDSRRIGPDIQYNLQVQINDSAKKKLGWKGGMGTTIAHVLVLDSIASPVPGNHAAILTAVQAALKDSTDDGQSYSMTGTYP